jgi:hypothetical protein
MPLIRGIASSGKLRHAATDSKLLQSDGTSATDRLSNNVQAFVGGRGGQGHD